MITAFPLKSFHKLRNGDDGIYQTRGSLALLYLARIEASSSFVIGKSNRSQPSVPLSAMSGDEGERERERWAEFRSKYLHIPQLPSLPKSDNLRMSFGNFLEGIVDIL